jgi:plasmid maintenance system killer protein
LGCAGGRSSHRSCLRVAPKNASRFLRSENVDVWSTFVNNDWRFNSTIYRVLYIALYLYIFI